MKFIYLPTLNILIILFNKSGSTLYGAWIENFVSFLGLPFELKTDMDDDYMEYIINLYSKLPKIYFFVRNPLERMITSFYWVETFDIKSKEDKFPFDEFVEFAHNIEDKLLNTTDMHLLPQSWDLVKINNYINDRENSMFEFKNFRYDKRFFKGCETVIIQIENFQRNFDALMQFAFTQRHTPNYKTLEDISENVYYKKSFGLFTELCDDKNKFEKMFSIILYNFVETNIKKSSHHNNLYKGMLQRLEKTKIGVESLNMINEVVANESKWLGYNNSLILNTNKFN